jgi:flagellar hook-associated protein 2
VNLGKIAIQVNDGARDLMNVNMSNNADASLGALVEYKVNGATVRGNSRAITIAPNLTANLLSAQPGKDVTVTVGRSTDNFKTALNTFISSFNTVVSELDQQATGVLTGNSILSAIRTQLRSIVTSPISDGFDSLANIGVEFTREGTLTLNSVLFNEATEGKLDSLKNAIGSSSTSGFLKLATKVLNAVEHEGTGLLNSTIQTLDDSGKAQDSRIDGEQDRIDQLTRDLQARMAAADAMIAQLEQQATYFTNLFKTMNDSQNSNR